MKFALATNNHHKLTELKKLFSGTNHAIYSPKELGISFDVEETGTTFEANAQLKSEHLYSLTNMPSIADDSGICVRALNGEPGVYSARFGGSGLDDKQRTLKLLEMMKGKEDRYCFYYCAISYTTEHGTKFFIGKCEGFIAEDYDETGFGFGYDPIFYFPTINKRFSQITLEEKNLYSHRAIALKNFFSFLAPVFL